MGDVARGNVAQNLKEKIRANEKKLNKLVSVFLDGDIPREMYLQRKDLLMREKAGLLESETNVGQQRKNRLKPAREFVLSLNQAAKLVETGNKEEMATFLKNIGSNPTLKDKTLSCHWGELWEFTASAKGGIEIDSAILASAKSLRLMNLLAPILTLLGPFSILIVKTALRALV